MFIKSNNTSHERCRYHVSIRAPLYLICSKRIIGSLKLDGNHYNVGTLASNNNFGIVLYYKRKLINYLNLILFQ